MGVTVAVTRAACNTSSGNQDITTTDLGGLTPVACLISSGLGVSDGSAVDDASLMFGVSDGTTSYAWSWTSAHGVTTTDTGKKVDNVPIFIAEAGTQSKLGRATFVDFITNGIRINWASGDEPSSAYLVQIMFFAGTSVSAHVGRNIMPYPAAGTTDITAPGFTPDLVFSWIGTQILGDTDAANGGRTSFGVAHYDQVSTVTQRSYGYQDRVGQATVDVRCGFDETYGIRAVSNTGLGWEYDVDLGTFDANGWTYTATDGPRTDTDTYWLALNFDGAIDTKVITLDTPTSTGEDTESGIGFKPQALVVGMTFIESVGVVNGTTGGPIGIGFIDEDEMYSQSIASENAIGTSNTQSLSDDILNITTETGGTGVQATMPSGDVFVSNGFVLDFTQVEAAAKKWWVVAFEEESAGTPASDSQSAYVAGQDATTDSQAAYVSGQDVASDSQSAYMVGASAGGTSTDSQPAYAEGLTYMPFTEPWTGDNEDEWRRSHWEIDAG